MNRIPILLISPWLEGRKMEYEELLQLKQLRNYTEAQRQNDGTKRLFFFKNTGDLHLLIRLIENWPRYTKNVDKFHAENLGSLTPATTRKLFTLAKFYGVPEHRDSFDVLKNWIQLGDGSRFSRGHLEFAEIRELSEPGRVEALTIYSSQPLRFFFSASHINQFSKPEFVSRCRAILAREKAIQLCGERWAQLKQSDPDLVQAVLAGNYDTDIAMNNKVFFFVIFLTP
jgi:hypothetical protein